MYRLGAFYSQPVHFRHSRRKCTGAGFSFLAGTFWPFWAKMYQLGVFYSQPVHFGHFGRKCTCWGFFILSRYILAILGENVPAGGFCILSWYILAILGQNVANGGLSFFAGLSDHFQSVDIKLVIVLDSHYVYDGLNESAFRW